MGPGARGEGARSLARPPGAPPGSGCMAFLDPEELGRGQATAAWPGGLTLEGGRVRNRMTRGAGGAHPRRDGQDDIRGGGWGRPARLRRRSPRGCTHSSPVLQGCECAGGEVAGCRACREERGFLPEGGAGPDVLFWECSKGVGRLEKEMQASLHRGLESHPIFGLHVGCPCFVVPERLALHISAVGFGVRSKLQVVHLSQDCKILRPSLPVSI